MNKMVGQNVKSNNNFIQIFTILTANLLSLTGGFLSSWPSPSIPLLISDKINYNITLDEASYFTVLPPLGFIASSVFISSVVDIVGRKYVVWFMALPYIISWCLISATTSINTFYVARFISGLGDGCIYTALPMYVAEVSSPDIRDTWGNASNVMSYFGQLIINIIGSYVSIRHTAYVCLIVPVIFVCGFGLMPETPYYYLMKEQEHEARRSLKRLRNQRDVDEELEKLKTEVKRQMSESGTWKDFFTIEANRKATYTGIFLRLSQQLSGMSAFSVYSQYVLGKDDDPLSATTSAIIFNAFCFVLSFTGVFVLDRFGRKKAYLYSCLLYSMILVLMVIYFCINEFCKEVDLTYFTWFPLTGLTLSAMFYSVGLGVLPNLTLGELFSASVKAKGLCVLCVIYGLLSSIVPKMFHVLDTTVGSYAPYVLFSISCLISGLLSPRFVWESKGRTLEEIQELLRKQDINKCNNNENKLRF